MRYLFSLLTLITLHASGQHYTSIESEAKVKDFSHETFTTSSGKYVDVLHYFPQGPAKYRDGRSTIIAVYDHQLKQLLSKDLEITDGKWFEGGYTVGDDLILFFSDKAKAVYGYKLNVEDGTASLIAELPKPANSDARLETGLSNDESHFYFVYKTFSKKEPSTYTGTITNKQLKVVNKFTATDEELDKNIANTQYAISDDGVFNIITAVKGSGTNKDNPPLSYTVTQIDASGKASSEHLKDIPAGYSKITWRAVKSDIQFFGLLKNENDTAFTAVIRGVYDGVQKKVIESKKTNLERGISFNATSWRTFTLKDNSTIFMFEEGERNYTTYMPINSRGFSSEHTTTTIKSLNLHVVKINSNDELAWAKTVYKNQLEINHDTYTGSVVLRDNKDGFHIFFQDCLKNTNPEDANPHRILAPGNGKKDALAVVYINKDGKMTKKFLEQDKHSDVLFSTSSVIRESGNRLIYTNYQHKNVGRSFYHLAAITVK